MDGTSYTRGGRRCTICKERLCWLVRSQRTFQVLLPHGSVCVLKFCYHQLELVTVGKLVPHLCPLRQLALFEPLQ